MVRWIVSFAWPAAAARSVEMGGTPGPVRSGAEQVEMKRPSHRRGSHDGRGGVPLSLVQHRAWLPRRQQVDSEAGQQQGRSIAREHTTLRSGPVNLELAAPLNQRMPVVFFGHGSPQNALGGNRYTDAWRDFGAARTGRGRSSMISAHWYAAGTRVTASARPRTNHDFVSFKGAVSSFQYPAPGRRRRSRGACASCSRPMPVALDEHWGYDHGAWNVLANAYPKADVPVVELSLDRTQPPAFHYDLAARLAPLRDEGVLIVGSGNVIHNQEIGRNAWPAEPDGWEQRFNDDLRARLERGDHAGARRLRKTRPGRATRDSRRPTTTCRFSPCSDCSAATSSPTIFVDGDGPARGLGMLSVAMG